MTSRSISSTAAATWRRGRRASEARRPTCPAPPAAATTATTAPVTSETVPAPAASASSVGPAKPWWKQPFVTIGVDPGAARRRQCGSCSRCARRAAGAGDRRRGRVLRRSTGLGARVGRRIGRSRQAARAAHRDHRASSRPTHRDERELVRRPAPGAQPRRPSPPTRGVRCPFRPFEGDELRSARRPGAARARPPGRAGSRDDRTTRSRSLGVPDAERRRAPGARCGRAPGAG